MPQPTKANLSNVRVQDGPARERWVETWREGVRRSPHAVGLFDLPSSRVIELSKRGVELLGTSGAEAADLGYLSPTARPEEVATTVRLFRDGVLDAAQARCRFRAADGSLLDGTTYGWAIRSGRWPDMGLWIGTADASEANVVDGAMELAAPADVRASLDDPRRAVVMGSLDDRWRISRVNAERTTDRRAKELIGLRLIELVHPDDVAPLLVAFARATAYSSAAVHVRVVSRAGTWQTSSALIMRREGEGSPQFCFGLAQLPAAPGSGDRLAQLELHLWRIAAEIQAADIVDSLGGPPDLGRLSTMNDLTTRQWEVASRLVRGERVPTIARQMYLSQSTIRNHLSTIFRKAGVHSQQELIARLRGVGRDVEAAG